MAKDAEDFDHLIRGYFVRPKFPGIQPWIVTRVKTIKPRSLVIVLFALALSLLGVSSHAAVPWKQGAPEQSSGASKSSGDTGGKKSGSGPQGQPAAEPARAPTLKETMAQVGRIAEELKQIDGRLQHLEKSVAGIDKSLLPVGNALKPETIREIVNEAGDVALDRARSLILLAVACLAALMVLYAILRRWIFPAPRAAERKGD